MKNILAISDENNLKVKEIMKDVYKPASENNVILDDLQKQENQFHEKLKERRSKRASFDIQLEKGNN